MAEKVARAQVGDNDEMRVRKRVTGAGARESEQDGVTDAGKNEGGVSPTKSWGRRADEGQIRGITVDLLADYRRNGGVRCAELERESMNVAGGKGGVSGGLGVGERQQSAGQLQSGGARSAHVGERLVVGGEGGHGLPRGVLA
ncbi:hypothetical protein, partial [Paraburkholderia ginsengiterrae]|uniref:hypothetical protein n=1 Tax=Paraburkholderia ginsengiterrae TaxID=1462993 RepID=UPI001ABFF247